VNVFRWTVVALLLAALAFVVVCRSTNAPGERDEESANDRNRERATLAAPDTPDIRGATYADPMTTRTPVPPPATSAADERQGETAGHAGEAAPNRGYAPNARTIPKNDGGFFAVDKAAVQTAVDRQLGPLLRDCYRDMQTRRPGMELDTTLTMQLTWMAGSGFIAHSPDIDDASAGDADFADCARQSIATIVLPFDLGDGPDQFTMMVPVRFRTRRPGDVP